MPMRFVVGTRGARTSTTSLGELVVVLDEVPAGHSVIVMAIGPEGLTSDIEHWASLAHKYDAVCIYVAMSQMPEWIRGRLELVNSQDQLINLPSPVDLPTHLSYSLLSLSSTQSFFRIRYYLSSPHSYLALVCKPIDKMSQSSPSPESSRADTLQNRVRGKRAGQLDGLSPHPGSLRNYWSIISFDRLLSVWRTGTADDHYQYLLTRMQRCQMKREENAATFGLDGILQNGLLNAC